MYFSDEDMVESSIWSNESISGREKTSGTLKSSKDRMTVILNICKVLLFTEFFQTLLAKAVLIGIHDYLHFLAVNPYFFAPAIIISLTGEKFSAGRTFF
jgi:hypothetical protein